ncbi:MAG TPA: 1-acyl-sn-glycerol-3-phosphate acyltransferase [Tepidisphaeraceae bacterium]|nr:1-acyl-sn-glycerol-3-phosphate acyltransferase [Tepidisphaeraceae bacterium]
MLRFSDQPYTYTAPAYFAPTAWCVRQALRLWRLPFALRVTHLEVRHAERLKSLRSSGSRIVLLPNHSTHVDAPIVIEAMRQVGVVPRIMAAYDVFLRGRTDAFVMKRLGCFSVNRDSSDRASMDEAIKTIDDGNFALTLFPEGNVFLENDRIAPFNDGAAFITTRAAKPLIEKIETVLGIPISIKLTHHTDARPAIRSILNQLAQRVKVKIDTNDPISAMKSIGLAELKTAIARRSIEMPPGDDIAAITRVLADSVLSKLEPELGLAIDSKLDPLERIRRARRVIHEIRTDPDQSKEHRRAARLADDAHLAFQIASYSGDYVGEKPTLDRVGETVEKLYEDLHEVILPPYAPRTAIVQIGPPIDVSAAVKTGARPKQIVAQLTELFEQGVQRGIDQINSTLDTHGSKLW